MHGYYFTRHLISLHSDHSVTGNRKKQLENKMKTKHKKTVHSETEGL